METKNTMAIPERDAILILASYFGCKAQIKTQTSRAFTGFLNEVSVIKNNSHFAISMDLKGPSRVSCHLLEQICLLVKPLEIISGDHLFYLSKILGFPIEEIKAILSGKWLIGKESKLLFALQNDWLNRRDVTEFLRENGYVTPYKNWNVTQLTELGIYKLID